MAGNDLMAMFGNIGGKFGEYATKIGGLAGDTGGDKDELRKQREKLRVKEHANHMIEANFQGLQDIEAAKTAGEKGVEGASFASGSNKDRFPASYQHTIADLQSLSSTSTADSSTPGGERRRATFV